MRASILPPTIDPADAMLAHSLAKLWPHRLHESNCMKNLLCYTGLHRWSELDLKTLLPERHVRFCRWCTKIKLDGMIY